MHKVSSWRIRAKETLVKERGSKCLDCSKEFPPFMFDFDHRDPSTKEFGIASKSTYSLARQREEAAKCDMVCGNCHRFRTHKQRCKGCSYCSTVS